MRPTISDRLEKVLFNETGVETMQNTCFIYFYLLYITNIQPKEKKKTKALKICPLTFS